MKDGFLRVACATPKLKVADCSYNTDKIISLIKEAGKNSTSLVVFPELSITGSTCGDLFFQKKLLDDAKQSLIKIVRETYRTNVISVVGLPMFENNQLYNVAAVIFRGTILGFVPKNIIPKFNEFSQNRIFSNGFEYRTIFFDEKLIPFGTDIIFKCDSLPNFSFGIEIGNNSFMLDQISYKLAKSGANIILNMCAENEFAGKAQYRSNFIKVKSQDLRVAILHSQAGNCESTANAVYSGHNIIAENGEILVESKPFSCGLITCEIDLQAIAAARLRSNITSSSNLLNQVKFSMPLKELTLSRNFKKHPFLPSDKMVSEFCEEVLMIQALGLAKRIKHINAQSAILGISGGLDSTLALIVTKKAFEILGLDNKNIFAINMPCFGTTQNTKNLAKSLSQIYDVNFLEISIKEAILKHFNDISHNKDEQNNVYENAQARERTQILMDIANQKNGIVVGTGDLSEIALGWSTYGGDHLSMYCVNCSIPKTLVRYLISYEMNNANKELKDTLSKILSTPISPELIPADNNISQQTEKIIGPYELHDFFVYYFVKFGFTPEKILRMACLAFADSYDKKEIKNWLTVFITRFFNYQFKRSCAPDGPNATGISLSANHGFIVPSDICNNDWLL